MKDEGKSFVESLIPDPDVIVIAGDFATHKMMMIRLSEVCEKFRHVIFVCGNHELYLSNRGEVHNTLSKLSSRYSNFHWLNETDVTVDNQRFIGATLWFTPGLQTQMNKHLMNDYRTIQGFSKWIGEVNRSNKEFFEREALSTDICVSHHLPLWSAVDPNYQGDSMNHFYVTDMHYLINKVQPRAWIHGHSHEPIDMMCGDTRIARNPRGYQGAVSNSWKPLIIEV